MLFIVEFRSNQNMEPDFDNESKEILLTLVDSKSNTSVKVAGRQKKAHNTLHAAWGFIVALLLEDDYCPWYFTHISYIPDNYDFAVNGNSPSSMDNYVQPGDVIVFLHRPTDISTLHTDAVQVTLTVGPVA